MASLADVDKHRVTAVLVSHNGAVWLPEVVAALTSQTRPIDLITAVGIIVVAPILSNVGLSLDLM